MLQVQAIAVAARPTFDASARFLRPAIEEGVKLGVAIVTAWATTAAVAATGAGIGFGAYNSVELLSRHVRVGPPDQEHSEPDHQLHQPPSAALIPLLSE